LKNGKKVYYLGGCSKAKKHALKPADDNDKGKRHHHTHIQEEKGDMSETFTADGGWFKKSKRRTNLHGISITDEEASANIKAVQVLSANLKDIIQRGNYPPELDRCTTN
jgi:hypothetical protein